MGYRYELKQIDADTWAVIDHKKRATLFTGSHGDASQYIQELVAFL